MTHKSNISRRNFLRIFATAGVAGMALKLGLESWETSEMVSETRLLLGTMVNIKAVADDPAIARRAIRACLDRMESLERILSLFKPDSQICRLNQDGCLTDAHPALISLIRQSVELGELTNGAFDITIKPLLGVYQTNPGKLPSARQIDLALKSVDYRKIHWQDDTVALLEDGMAITLDGIAKGYIIDQGAAVLKEYGFSNVVIEAGGDLVGLGHKAPGSAWVIGIQSPRSEVGVLQTTHSLQNQALATSGDYMQAFTSDYSQHHILNPHSGHSSPELASVSIIAPSAMLADGLATAMMVLGREGLVLVEDLADCEAYAVTKEAQIIKTSGWKTG